MAIDDLGNEEIRRREAEIRARNTEMRPTYQHYGSVENLSDSEIRGMEAEIRARNTEVRPTYQHYGSVENLGDSEIKVIEAQVLEKRQQDVPYKEYLSNLISDPNVMDEQQFENAVIRSMQSNGIMREFTSNLVQEISKATYEFKSIEKTDSVSIDKQKQKVEKLVNLYIKYLYELKKHEWSFDGPGNDIGLEMLDSDLLDVLWKIQKQFDISFEMPIPKNLGEYYGQAFERKGKMIPGITLMYDDLKNKDVNWHQVLIYKENELTPRQRYMKRKEEALKQFELARQEEVRSVLASSRAQNQSNNNIDNQEEVITSSRRR